MHLILTPTAQILSPPYPNWVTNLDLLGCNLKSLQQVVLKIKVKTINKGRTHRTTVKLIK